MTHATEIAIIVEGLRQAASAPWSRSTASTSRARPARCSACSGRTAPARPPRCASSPRSCSPTAGRRRGARHRRGATTRRPSASSIGLAGQYAAVDENLTGHENLRMVGQLTHLPKATIRGRGRRAARALRPRRRRATARCARTRGGMRRRLDLAAALVHRPPVLFLDEPTTGLDPRSRTDLWGVIEELVADGTTLLLTTQYLEEADRLADNIVVIDHGRVIAEGTSSRAEGAARRDDRRGRLRRRRDRATRRTPSCARSACARSRRPSHVGRVKVARRRQGRARRRARARRRRPRARDAERPRTDARRRVPLAHRPRGRGAGRRRSRSTARPPPTHARCRMTATPLPVRAAVDATASTARSAGPSATRCTVTWRNLDRDDRAPRRCSCSRRSSPSSSC